MRKQFPSDDSPRFLCSRCSNCDSYLTSFMGEISCGCGNVGFKGFVVNNDNNKEGSIMSSMVILQEIEKMKKSLEKIKDENDNHVILSLDEYRRLQSYEKKINDLVSFSLSLTSKPNMDF